MPDRRLVAALAAHDPAAITAALHDLPGDCDETVLDRIRPHLGGLTLDLRAVAQLGKALLSLCSPLGPPSAAHPVLSRRAITVMGTSHVRFFGAHRLFFPLFIGMGPDTLCLTDDSHAVARRKVLDNLARVDPDADLILDLGAEPFYHVRDVLGTRPDQETTMTRRDLACMAATAERYAALLREVRDRRHGRLILFNVLPTYDRIGNALSVVLNDLARTICRHLGILFLDIWDRLLDPSSGLLRRAFAAQAYNEDTHLNEAAIPLVLDALRELGVASEADTVDAAPLWRHVFAFPVSPGGDTRIWCEADVIPANAYRSEKVAASFVANAALAVLLPIIVGSPDCRVLVLNAKDGFLPISLPQAAAARVVGVCDDRDYLEVALRVAAFAGRADLELVADTSPLPPSLADAAFDVGLIVVHPASIAHDLERAAAMPGMLQSCRQYVLGPANLFQREAAPPLAVRRFYPLGNRHLPGMWPEYGLFMA